MINLRVVTGYVPIPNHPRSSQEYARLGDEVFGSLHNSLVPIISFLEKVSACWLYSSLTLIPYSVDPLIADNPRKNTIAYHCVQHQKFRWLCYAAYHNPDVDTFVWIDYGIGHVPGVTAAVIYKFLERIKKDDFAIPGCWPQNNFFDTSNSPDWRFCGGLMVVPRDRVNQLYAAIRQSALATIDRTRKVTWEVNTLADVEDQIQPRWYYADHNQQMFENY